MLNNKCEYCEGEITNQDYYYIYCYVVDTDKQMHYIGLQKILERLIEYLMNKTLHLSATEILIFRPDIMKKYLETIYTEEKINAFYFKKYVICYECYEEYCNLVPLI